MPSENPTYEEFQSLETLVTNLQIQLNVVDHLLQVVKGDVDALKKHSPLMPQDVKDAWTKVLLWMSNQ